MHVMPRLSSKIFGVYMCGDIAYFLSRWPNLCPQHSAKAPAMLQTSLQTLIQLEEAWPLAHRWRVTLQGLVASTAATVSCQAAAAEQRALDESVGVAAPSASPVDEWT
jgi:hypothetical protein